MIFRVRGVNRVRSKGRTYYYHRKTGQRITAPYGTEAFMLEVMRLNGPQARETPKPQDSTLAALIQAYRTSPEFLQLAERTRTDYARVFRFLEPIGDLKVSNITPKGVIALRDKAFKKHKRRLANHVVQVLSVLFNWGKPREWLKHNPAEDVELFKRPKDARKVNRAWTDEEISVVIHAAPCGTLRVAIGIGLFTGMREGDVVTVAKSKYDGKSFATRAHKNGRELWIPAHQQLREILSEVPKTDAVTLVANRHGRPYTEEGFRGSFFKLIRKLHNEGKVGTGLTFHGLRHTTGKLLAEAGCTTEDIMEILGVTREMAEHYSAEANRKFRAAAAIEKLEQSRPNFAKPPERNCKTG